ncbi:hypothetical protein AAHA92_18006 [Salvia divinorum]|uniref:Uncharacterized protein n=1 Tax=Salvia divinorum TaxID=28513 RepID=A0ABD1H196_SALDI
MKEASVNIFEDIVDVAPKVANDGVEEGKVDAPLRHWNLAHIIHHRRLTGFLQKWSPPKKMMGANLQKVLFYVSTTVASMGVLRR